MGKIVKKHIGSFLLVGILIFIANTLSVLHPYIVKEVVRQRAKLSIKSPFSLPFTYI